MATVMLAAPEAIPAVGVKVAVRTRPEPLRAPRVPFAREISADVKLEPGFSLKVKLMAAVSPLFRAAVLLLIATVGARVSMVIEGVVPALPVLPAASV